MISPVILIAYLIYRHITSSSSKYILSHLELIIKAVKSYKKMQNKHKKLKIYINLCKINKKWRKYFNTNFNKWDICSQFVHKFFFDLCYNKGVGKASFIKITIIERMIYHGYKQAIR